MEFCKYFYECFDGLVWVEECFVVIKSFSVKIERGLDFEVDVSNVFVFMILIRVGGVGLNFVVVDIVCYFWFFFYY